MLYEFAPLDWTLFHLRGTQTRSRLVIAFEFPMFGLDHIVSTALAAEATGAQTGGVKEKFGEVMMIELLRKCLLRRSVLDTEYAALPE